MSGRPPSPLVRRIVVPLGARALQRPAVFDERETADQLGYSRYGRRGVQVAPCSGSPILNDARPLAVEAIGGARNELVFDEEFTG